MKVFWLLLFGICIFPFIANAYCRSNDAWLVRYHEHYCLVEIYEEDESCILKYSSSSMNDIGNETTLGRRGCIIQNKGKGLCYCKEDHCNGDILNFQVELRQKADRHRRDPKLKGIINCLVQATNQECAVGKPEKIIFKKREKGQKCSITLKKHKDTYKIDSVEIALRNSDSNIQYCEERNDTEGVIICKCNNQWCNIRKDAFHGMSSEVAKPAYRAFESVASGVKTCGNSLAMYEPVGAKSCAKVFEKHQNGTCTTEFAFVRNDQKRTGCIARGLDVFDDAVTCVCEGDKCGVQNHLAVLQKRLDGEGCVQAIPETTTSAPTTTTTAMTTTTPPKQLTCWASDISTVTKDKTNSVCFIDYTMINSKCELRGKGIVEEDNTTPGCRIVDNQNKGGILRCTCLQNRCNQELDGMWEKMESNNTEHVELIECVGRLVHGATLPTSGTTSCSETEDAKSSIFFGLFIGSAAFNALLVVTIVALIVALLKMKKKGSEAKQGTTKIEQKEQQKPTAIQIEKPIVKKESSTKPTRTSTAKVADRHKDAADTTANEDLDTTGGTTGSDSTGPEEGFNEVRVSVRGLKNK